MGFLGFVALNFSMMFFAVTLHQGIRRAASGLLGQTMMQRAPLPHLLITGISSWVGVVAFFGALILPFFYFDLLPAIGVAIGTLVVASLLAAAILLPWHRRGPAFFDAWYGGVGILISLCLLGAVAGTMSLIYLERWS